MNPITILVDQDNVIADQRRGFYDMLEKKYPHIERPLLDSLDHFDIELAFPVEHRELIKAVRRQKGFFSSLPEVAGAKEGLQRLVDAGHHVRIVTAPTWEWKHCIPEKYAWIEKHLGRDWVARTILARDKTFVRGDILIDDAPSISGAINPTWEHILYTQPYNTAVANKDRITWDTVDAYIDAWRKRRARDI